ncbi:polyprenyl synthetase family protein [Corynebacterium sp. MSK297]|uniref:polyprenyl synthetase family protein n=1 Tax=Corynebacterium sp. MSK297 TaxID=3050221 RepID=UPI00254AB277|nr:polyprenyl synthetase family protein [Corynebacterium sp. MSK297]MDK8845492.1 polyprenyl synthetase family protein [Corynebacterium sp. MSK297]
MTTGQNQVSGYTPAVDLGDEQLNSRIAAGMETVEDLLRSELSQGAEFITDKVLHLTTAGGKRFRPMMALLAAEYGPHAESDNVYKAASVVEIVHLATLYHDDVMDEADQRRGVESANSRWNNSVAILSGDVLLAHASRIMSSMDSLTVRHFGETFQELVTGQMRETLGAGESNPVEHYQKVIEEKTAVLIASAGYLGAYHAGADEPTQRSLQIIGGAIGMIFQIVDDIIDLFSDPKDSGKIPGTDLREGVFTLPVLYALEDDSAAGSDLRALLTGPLEDEDDVQRAIALIRETNGRAQALADVQAHLDVVDRELDKLPDIAATRALRVLAEYTMRRVG